MKTRNTDTSLPGVKTNGWWDAINSINAAKKVARQGVWAAGFVSVMTSLLIVAGIGFGTSIDGRPTLDA